MKNGFPIDKITPEMSVLCLFSAAFNGENDVWHIHTLGCKKVLLVDIDSRKLINEGLFYGYQTLCTDIVNFLERDVKISKFDIVISDQWSDMDDIMNVKYIGKLLSMANKYVFLSCGEKWLQGSRPEGEYYRRSNHNGGTYWRVLCK